MIEYSWVYSLLPAAVAITCLSLLHRLFKNGSELVYKRLFINLSLLDICMSLAYIVFSFSRVLAEHLADAYLISFYFLFAHLLMMSLSLSPWQFMQQRLNYIYIFPLIITAMHLNGLLIDGYRVESNSLLHNDGSFAWVMDVYLLTALISTTTILTVNIRKHSAKILISKNILALFAFFIVILALFATVLLSMTRNPVPAVMLIPPATLITAFIFYYISKSDVIDLSIGIHNVLRRIVIAIKYISNSSNVKALREIQDEQEKQLLQEGLERESNAKSAAKYIDMPASTFHEKARKHGLGRAQDNQD